MNDKIPVSIALRIQLQSAYLRKNYRYHRLA